MRWGNDNPDGESEAGLAPLLTRSDRIKIKDRYEKSKKKREDKKREIERLYCEDKKREKELKLKSDEFSDKLSNIIKKSTIDELCILAEKMMLKINTMEEREFLISIFITEL